MSANSNETTLTGFFAGDHSDCDTKWATVENHLDGGDNAAITTAWEAFNQATRRHLAMEEELMFPAFEAMSGMGQSGPTVIMRQEHEQMRALLDQIGFLIHEGDTDEALDLGDTLHMLTQQHNMKEEGML
jgi:hemerythrin-like domain-containing protein